jgi:hypothetical protein
VLQSFQ